MPGRTRGLDAAEERRPDSRDTGSDAKKAPIRWGAGTRILTSVTDCRWVWQAIEIASRNWRESSTRVAEEDGRCELRPQVHGRARAGHTMMNRDATTAVVTWLSLPVV